MSVKAQKNKSFTHSTKNSGVWLEQDKRGLQEMRVSSSIMLDFTARLVRFMDVSLIAMGCSLLGVTKALQIQHI